MRISVDPADPGYVQGSSIYQVYLDGRQLKDCVTADEERGNLICYKHENGKPVINKAGDEFVLETLQGKVEIAKLVRA